MSESWLLDVRYLLFSGGGARGLAFLGAIKALREAYFLLGKNLLHSIQGYGGSSIGALVATACATNLEFDEIHSWAIRMNHDMQGLLAQMDFTNPIQGKLGLVDNSKLRKHVENLIQLRFKKNDITFGEFYQTTKKILKVTESNITTRSLKVYDYENTPMESVVDRVVASMCMPVVFTPVIRDGEYCVDGGMYMNFGIHLFPADQVLGIRIRTESFLPKNPSITEYLGELVLSTMEFYEDQMLALLPKEYHDRVVTVQIPSGGILEMLHVPLTKVTMMINYGEQAMYTYLFRHFFMGEYFTWMVSELKKMEKT